MTQSTGLAGEYFVASHTLGTKYFGCAIALTYALLHRAKLVQLQLQLQLALADVILQCQD